MTKDRQWEYDNALLVQICPTCKQPHQLKRSIVKHRTRNNLPMNCEKCSAKIRETSKRYNNLTCEHCGTKFNSNQHTYDGRKQKGLPHLCRVCAKKNYANLKRQEYARKSQKEKDKIAEHLRSMQPIRTPEFQSKASKARWDQLTVDEREFQIEQLHANWYKWYLGNERTIDEEKKYQHMLYMNSPRVTHLTKISRDFWSKVTEKERQEINKKISKSLTLWWNSLSDDERVKRSLERSNRVRESFQKYWRSLTPDQLDAIKLRMTLTNRKRWDTMSPEEFKKQQLKRSCAQASANTKPKQTELDFEGFLRINDIKYDIQRYNLKEHDQFKKKFKSNPITGSKRVSPYHRWDFLVHSKLKDVYIDVDGSYHVIEPGKFIVNGFDVGAYTQFNDSQRPYQTDGLDAYVVLAYGDIVSEDTAVMSFQNNELITVKQLISILKE